MELDYDSGTGTIGSLTKKYYYSSNSQILAQDISNGPGFNKYFYLHDRLGSVRMLIDTTAAVVKNTYTYNPYGEDITDECPENVDNPWKYTGQYYLRARQYDPKTARFTGRDPVRGTFKEPATLHAYLYCLNDPLNNTDTSGQSLMLDLVTSSAFRTGMAAYNTVDSINRVKGYAARLQNATNWRNTMIDIAIEASMEAAVGWGAGELLGFAAKGIGKSAALLGAMGRHGDEAIEQITRKLGADDLGIDASKIISLKGTVNVVDDITHVSVDMIEAQLSSPRAVIPNLIEMARKNGSKNLVIEASIANDKLLRILQKTYNVVTVGGKEFIMIDL